MEKQNKCKLEPCEDCQEKDQLIEKLFRIIAAMQDLLKTSRHDDVKCQMKVVR